MATVKCERGSATVLTLALIAVVIAAALVAAAVGSVAADRARARGAADLSALAAAHAERVRDAGLQGAEACDVGAAVALANQTTVVECRVAADGSVTVTVRAGTATAWARAGRDMRWPGDASG
jgi:secretion/DNA translocation related TadE-like protein